MPAVLSLVVLVTPGVTPDSVPPALAAALDAIGAGETPVLASSRLDERVHPSLTWTHPEQGRTIGVRELARVAAHAAAWAEVDGLDGDAIALVAEADATLEPAALAAALADAAGDDDWSVVALDGVRAYLMRPAAAATLLDPDLLADAVPLPAMFGMAPDDLDDEPSTAHLVVLQVDDRRELADALGDVDPHALVIAVPRAHRVLADAAELCATYAHVADGMVLLAASRHAPDGLDAAVDDAHPDAGTEYRYVSALGVAGPAALIADALLGRDELDDALALTGAYLDGVAAIDSSHALFHVVDPGFGDTVVVHGRVVNGGTDTAPAVVVAVDDASFAAVRAELDGDGSRDLARVFRYDDAVDPAADWRVVAADIVEVPFWTPEFCATIIRLAEAAEAWDRDPDDPVPGAEVSLAALSPRLFAHVQTHVDRRVMPVLREVWPEMAHTALHDAFVIKYAVGAHDELRLHHDVAQISASLRLCDTYAGGRLEFPRQQWHNGGLGIGRLAVWPSLVTHPHRSTPVESGVKYGVTLWWKLPE